MTYRDGLSALSGPGLLKGGASIFVMRRITEILAPNRKI
jgi:hypothetical protein